MIGARMLRSRKGIDYAALLSVVVFIALVYLLIVLEHKSAEFQREIGDNQLALLNSYSQGEAMLFYVDQAAKYSAQKTVYDFIGNGGFATKEDASQICGEPVNGYVTWNKQGKYVLCAPDTPKLYENFGKILNSKLNNYFESYNKGYLVLDKSAILSSLPETEKECLKQSGQYWDSGGGCVDCITDCADYSRASIFESYCKLDPCKIGCYWTNNECIKQFTAPASLPKDNYDFLVKQDRVLGIANQPALLLIFAPPKEVVAKFLGFVIGRYEIIRGAMGDYAVKPSFNVEINSGLDNFRLIMSKAETMLQECAKKLQALISYCVNDTIVNQNLGWSWQTTDQETFLFDIPLKEPVAGAEKPVLKFALDIYSIIPVPPKLLFLMNTFEEAAQFQKSGENDLRRLTLGYVETAWLYKDGKWVLLAKGSEYEVGGFQIPDDTFNRFKEGVFYHTHTVATETLKEVINAAREAGLENPAIKNMLKESVKKPMPPTFPQDFDMLALQMSVAVVSPSGVWLAKAKPMLTEKEYTDLRNTYLGTSGKEDVTGFVAELNKKGAEMTYAPFVNDLVIDEYLDSLLS